jgi:molybdate transport system ATP-binding protein
MLGLDVQTGLGQLELDASIEVGDAECLALAGPSGAGKSSILRVAAGLLHPRTGTVRCNGEVWLDTGRRIDVAPDRRRVGYLFQDYALFGHLSAWRNVAYGIAGGRAQRRERAHALLDRFGLAARADAKPATLSGGERQRVALARALARDPAVLLLDEPLSALDATTRARAGRELAELVASARVPALLVTHDFEEAALLADRIAVVDGGSVIQVGTATELAASPISAFVADLTGAVVMTGTARPEGDLTAVDLEGGGSVSSTDRASGHVAVTVHPWEISLEPEGSQPSGSARNRLPVTVTSVTAVGNRVRVGMISPQPMVAELSGVASEGLALAPGVKVVAAFKATATRLVSR